MQDGKPADAPDVTVPAGTETQQTEATQPQTQTVDVSNEVRSYLKGLGLDNVPITAEFAKLAESGMKQKESVSRLSFEKEQLLARLESQGKDTTDPTPPTEPEPQPKVQPPVDTGAQIGVTENDLFDLVQMVATNFKEIAPQAEDGSLFKELRQLGYFTSQGINKKAIYDYLSAKNAAAAELAELRQFKADHSQPNPADNPMYNATPGLAPDGKLTEDYAKSIVMSGDQQNPRYAEALALLRESALKKF